MNQERMTTMKKRKKRKKKTRSPNPSHHVALVPAEIIIQEVESAILNLLKRSLRPLMTQPVKRTAQT
jgi:hypothetical protein